MSNLFQLLIFANLSLAAYCAANYKVGLLIGSADANYTATVKKITDYAISQLDETYVSLTIVTEEYDSDLLSTTGAVCSLIEQGVVAVISAGDSDRAAIESDILSRYKIPLVSISATDSYLKYGDREFLMMMAPADTYQTEAIFRLLQLKGWTMLGIIASGDDYGIHGVMDLIYFNHLVHDESNFNIKVVQYVKDTDEDYIRSKLQHIKDSLITVILVNCQAAYGRVILKIAEELGMMDSGYVWIMTDALGTRPTALSYNGGYPSYYEGLLAIVPTLAKSTTYTAFKDKYILEESGLLSELNIYTLMAYDAVSVVHMGLEKIEKKADVTLTTHNLKCSEDSHSTWDKGATMFDYLTRVSATGVSGRLEFTDAGDSHRTTYDIMNFRETGFVKVGSWTASKGLKMVANIEYLGGRTDTPSAHSNTFAGRHLRLGIVEEKPMAMKRTDHHCEGHYDEGHCWYGYSIDLISIMQADLNFTYELVEPADDKYGGFHDGKWNGMIGDLIAGRIDIIATKLAVNVERKKVVEFLFPFAEDVSTAIVMGSSVTQNKFFFLAPFGLQVWLLVGVAGVVITLFLNVFNKLSPYGKYGSKIHALQTCTCNDCIERRANVNHMHCSFAGVKKFDCETERADDEDPLEDISLYDSAWTISSGFVGQGGETVPRSLTARFLLFAWWFFVMIAVSLYTANLTAFLTLKRAGVAIDSTMELLEQRNLDWGVITDRNTESRMLNHINNDYAELVEHGKTLMNLNEAIAKVKEGEFVFIDEESVMQFYFNDDCDMIYIDNGMQSSEISFALGKNSPYEDPINELFLKYREEEVFSKLQEHWYYGDTGCGGQSIGDDTPFDIATLAGLFYVLIIAIFISMILIVLESLHAAIQDSRRKPGLTICGALRMRINLKMADIWQEWCGVGQNTPVIVAPSSVSPVKSLYKSPPMTPNDNGACPVTDCKSSELPSP